MSRRLPFLHASPALLLTFSLSSSFPELPGIVFPAKSTPLEHDPAAIVAFKHLREKVQTQIKRFRGLRPLGRARTSPHLSDFARLARRLCGASIGVVLGGGGGRGISHIVSQTRPSPLLFRVEEADRLCVLGFARIRASFKRWRTRVFLSISLEGVRSELSSVDSTRRTGTCSRRRVERNSSRVEWLRFGGELRKTSSFSILCTLTDELYPVFQDPERLDIPDDLVHDRTRGSSFLFPLVAPCRRADLLNSFAVQPRNLQSLQRRSSRGFVRQSSSPLPREGLFELTFAFSRSHRSLASLLLQLNFASMESNGDSHHWIRLESYSSLDDVSEGFFLGRNERRS